MIERVEVIRDQLIDLVRVVPFERFVITLENGDQVNVEHPENIAFDPDDEGTPYLHVISGGAAWLGSLDAVTGFIRRRDAEKPIS